MKTVVAGALGECVHVAGVSAFLQLAEQAGWRTVFLGPAVSPEDFIKAAETEKADLVGVSYRLTPETGERLLGQFAEMADHLREQGTKFAFGGTPPVADRAKKMGFFDAIFDGSQNNSAVLAYLKGEPLLNSEKSKYPQKLIERIKWKAPEPILRHHFGLPDLKTSVRGIEEISEAGVLDVISLGIDQDAQENFYHPERQDPRRRGAGGVPVRCEADYEQLYQASRRGNFPLMRTYSGTDDFIRLAEMYTRTIDNAWCAIPLFWFNAMDGRGPLKLKESIIAHQEVMRWYGERGIPVELNEPHHWGMRSASDVVFVVAGYLSAYNAKAMGVKDYIAQMMFNSPAGLAGWADLAKMQAILKLISTLEDARFRIWKQTRTGLLSYPLEENAARAHLATSITVQMALKPDIIHVVGHSEAHHAATARDVIDACLMAKKSIANALKDGLSFANSPRIEQRVEELCSEAKLLLDAIRELATKGADDPLLAPETLTKAVTLGLMDAPQLKNNRFGKGLSHTQIIDGMCKETDANGQPVDEKTRLARLLKED